MQRVDKVDRVTKRRQDPVSCKLCRVKKLKCNRQYPCGNCTQRGVSCEFENSRYSTPANVVQDAEPSNATILAKLQRVEDLLLRFGPVDPHTPESIQIRRDDLSTDQTPSPAVEDVEQLKYLRSQTFGITTRSESTLTILSDTFDFQIADLSQIAAHAATKPVNRTLTGHRTDRLVLLPPQPEAAIIMERYIKYICFYHYVIHIPTLRRIFEATYKNLSNGDAVKLSHVTLLLSCFAGTIWYTNWSEEDVSTLSHTSSRDGIFIYWVRCALDLLDHTERVLPSTLEDTQSSIVLILLDYNLEGFTSRVRSRLVRALQWARDQGMHKIDAKTMNDQETENSTALLIDQEIKRRVWWHLSSTDWMISLTGGLSEGTYSVHPAQMRVRLPRNIDDEALEAGNATDDLPLYQQTKMTYSIYRIKLAEIARNVIDVMRLGLAPPSASDYPQVIALDARLERFFAELPIFFKLDETSVQQTRHMIEAFPHLVMHRYVINVAAESIRCRLHAPFLARASDGLHARQSTELCLQAAMNVVQINQMIRSDPNLHITWQLKMICVLHHMFLATVVLVMDLCFNKAESENNTRRSEVISALSMLEDARGHSTAAEKFWETLMDTLKQHKVNLLEPKAGSDVRSFDTTGATQMQAHPTFNAQLANTIPQMNGSNVFLPINADSGLDNQWNDPSTQIQSVNWEQIFSELDGFIA